MKVPCKRKPDTHGHHEQGEACPYCIKTPFELWSETNYTPHKDFRGEDEPFDSESYDAASNACNPRAKGESNTSYHIRWMQAYRAKQAEILAGVR